MTDNLCRRVLEHKLKVRQCFTSKYNVDKLVYFEEFDNFVSASNREKQLKAGPRSKKVKLINTMNPDWHDFFEEKCAGAEN